MKIPHDQFCVLPWVSLEASPIGTVRPCCLAEDEIVSDQGQKFSLLTDHLADVQNSKHMMKLRQDFLDHKQPQTCRKCWNEERAGRTSKRMHSLDRLKHMIDDCEWTEQAKPLLFLDMKLGNICNLKCRICGSWSSSQFAAEELNDMPPDSDKKSSFPYRMLRAGAWPRDSEHFWTEIQNIVAQIHYIEFTGGEPFMIQEHFDFLQRLVDQGIAHQVEIHYNTNGTHWPAQAESIWCHFRHVEIAFSIDDVGARFEYQRTNAIWSEVCDNIQKFRELKRRHSNISLQVCCTVNVFNVCYLPEVAAWIEEQDFDFVYWNIMHEAWYFSVSTLPETAKIAIIHRLDSADIPTRFRSEFGRICEFMRGGASTDGFMLRMKIADLDRKRKQDLREVSPVLADLIDYAPEHSIQT